MWRDACDMSQAKLDPKPIRSSQHLFFPRFLCRPTPLSGQDLAMPHATSIAIAIGNVRATSVP